MSGSASPRRGWTAVPETITLDAPAKVNLRLCVLAREASGFHALETLFCAVSLSDRLEVRQADEPGIGFAAEGGVEMGPPGANLVVRAAERFYAALGREPRVAIRLSKRIPAAAGLGGGSSDAAAALRALNALHGEPLPPDELLRLGGELGSDVPFFLCGSPLAWAWGRGDRLLALPPLPVRPVLIAHPGTALATADAFRRIARARGAEHRVPAACCELAALTSWDGVAALAVNDFEPFADELVPGLAAARAAMAAAGAAVARLSGSGAALFGIFATAERRDRARAELRAAGMQTWAAETLAALPAPQVDRLRTNS